MRETQAMGMNFSYFGMCSRFKEQEVKSQSFSVPFPQAAPHNSSISRSNGH
jgi:hypothetical protein